MKKAALAPLDEAPKCRGCGKPLVPRYYDVREPLGRAASGSEFPEPPKVGELVFRTHGPAIVAILLEREGTLNAECTLSENRYRVWCGEWGRYGDNLFCGLNCGYRAAVRDHRRK